jgi:hypothetical protein
MNEVKNNIYEHNTKFLISKIVKSEKRNISNE